jgi:hypothetical protein
MQLMDVRRLKRMAGSLLVTAVVLTMTACAQRHTSSTWYNPTWTPSGNIMAVREDSTYYSGGGGLLGGGGAADTNCVLVEMGGDGSNERVLMELGREVTPRINVSPGGTYIALQEYPSNKVAIYRRNGMSLVSEISTEKSILTYDWSPAGDRLAVDEGGGGVAIIKPRGKLVVPGRG